MMVPFQMHIVLPLLVPAMTSLGILVFIWSWGAFLRPLVIGQDRRLQVLAVGLTDFAQSHSRTPERAASAASTLATLPIAVLFTCFQKYFIKGLTAAAVKG